jgi:1,2-dihydroxy-3-keto-5-methylthiopentene dioxygenase
MSRLDRFDAASGAPVDTTEDAALIAERLSAIGARFERWPTRTLPPHADDAAVLDAYADEIAALARAGYPTADVLRVSPRTPDPEALRAKFLSEHTHAEDEVRYFVEGAALFTLNAGGIVHNLRAEAGDLVCVPAGMRHWFDMGACPRFTVLRLFQNPEGWVARYTGDPIAERFPRFEPVPA